MMMYRLLKLMAILTLLVLALTACGGDETPTPTAPAAEVVVETATPAPTVVVEPTAAPRVIEHTPDPALIDKTWGWEARDPNSSDIASLDVPNPEHYTLTFNEDGTFSARVDCNNVAGEYASSPPDSIAISPGPSTLVACPPGSLADEMVKLFDAVRNFRFLENGNLLILAWAEGGPLDFFRLLDVQEVDLAEPAEGTDTAMGTVTAPDGIYLRTGPGTNYPYVGAAPFGETGEIIGVSEDGQWWLASAPQLPGGQVWVAAEFVEAQNAENVPVVTGHSFEPELIGIPWEWVSTTDPVQGTVAVNDPSRYLVLFNDDNTAYVKADCNNVQATFTVEGSSLAISLGASTRAACPPDSQGAVFLQQLANVAIYTIQGGNLYLDQMADGGTMRLVPQGAPVPAPEPPAAEAEANTLYLASFGPQSAPQPIIPGSIVLVVWADDRVAGYGGCNFFSGTVTPVSDYFTIGGILTGQKICAEPAGVMEQEQAFLAGLENVNGYRWQSQIVNGIEIITQGTLTYTLPDGSAGVMNFTANP